MARFSVLLTLLVAALAISCTHHVTAKDVGADQDLPKGTLVDEEGKRYITTDKGVKYLVYRDSETDKPFYFNPATNEPQWDDPREANKPREPRGKPREIKIDLGKKRQASFTTFMVVLIPTILFVGAVAGRIYYLHTYHPELLFPTKERKLRQRTAGGKFKAQKARGKMNQDGKGGRSANS